jgi:2-dehydropantoate 2-reductase
MKPFSFASPVHPPVVPGRVLVMGAGAIGCYVGGSLLAAGVSVTLVGRPRVMQAVRTHGLQLTDLRGHERRVPPSEVPVALEITPSLVECAAPTLVLLCVKSADTAQAVATLQAMLPPNTPVLSLQNGVDNVPLAQRMAPSLRVLPGMVPFNVTELGPGQYHRGTSGELMAQHHEALLPWRTCFEVAGLPLHLRTDMPAVQWAKLLMNLNNPVNALSGLPLRAQLVHPGYRRVLADLMAEALAVLKHAGQPVARLTPLPAAWLPTVLRLPKPLFRRLGGRMLRVDAQARSSMAEDVMLGRACEIDALCGAVVRLAQSCGIEAPLNAAMVTVMQQATQTRPAKPLSPEELVQALAQARPPHN